MKFKDIIYNIQFYASNNNPYKLIQRCIYKRQFLKSPMIKNLNLEQTHEIEIYSVAFNNAKLIKYQIRTFKKFIKDDFLLIIIDNSNDLGESQKICNLCIDNKVGYIKLSPNKLKGSRSHSMSVNYVWQNIISKRNCKFFGLIDHDIFPIQPYSIIDKIGKQDFYGALFDRNNWPLSGKAWILMPWFAFFRKEGIRKFDFSLKKSIFPFYIFDTGGSMYNLLYRKFDKNKIKFASSEFLYEKIDAMDLEVGNHDIKKFFQRFQYVDNHSRLHIMNAASALGIAKHRKMVQKKIQYTFDMLDKILN